MRSILWDPDDPESNLSESVSDEKGSKVIVLSISTINLKREQNSIL